MMGGPSYRDRDYVKKGEHQKKVAGAEILWFPEGKKNEA